MRSAIVTDSIELSALLREVADAGHGAVSVFLGTVRDVNDGRTVSGMEYTAYMSMAAAELARIVTEASSRFGTDAIVVEHRTGALAIGDVSVAIVVAHPHRAPALDATRFVIETLKQRVPIWKREHYTDGTLEWIDPTRATARTAP